jgi:SAM-dependent methyltransferase
MLAERVGSLRPETLAGMSDGFFDAVLASSWWDPDDAMASYDALGRELARTIRAALPQGWGLAGKRVLDFGCGTGGVLRHLLDEGAELWGCDLDGPSIAWLEQHLSSVRGVTSGAWPPLPIETDSFDLVYATSAYTRLTDSWSAWMLEHHRVLRPGGLLFASFAGPAVHEWSPGLLAWDPAHEGMAVRVQDAGRPAVFHAVWWIREHWGRAFEILNLVPDGLALPAGTGQGWALMRAREVQLRVEDLEP